MQLSINHKNAFVLMISIAFALGLGGCRQTTQEPAVLSIAGPTALTVGQAATYRVDADVASRLTWSSSNPASVQIAADGSAIAVAAGTARITASTSGFTPGTLDVTVQADPNNPNAPTPGSTTHVLIDGYNGELHESLGILTSLEFTHNNIAHTISSEPLSSLHLTPYTSILIGHPTRDISSADTDALLAYVNAGGHLILISDAVDELLNLNTLNDLAARFGAGFSNGVLRDDTQNIRGDTSHITTTTISTPRNNLNSISALNARPVHGVTPWISTSPTSYTVPIHSSSSVTLERDARIAEEWLGLAGSGAAGPHALAGTKSVGEGRLTLLGATSPFIASYAPELRLSLGLYSRDNCQLALNLVSSTADCYSTRIEPDQHEPNSSRHNASRIEPLIDTHIDTWEQLTITPGDTDWFVLDFPNDTHLTAEIFHCATSSLCTEELLAIHLLDAHGALLERSTPLVYGVSRTLPAGTYYLAVSDASDTDLDGSHTTSGPYSLITYATSAGTALVAGSLYATGATSTTTNSDIHTRTGVAPHAELIPGELIIQWDTTNPLTANATRAGTTTPLNGYALERLPGISTLSSQRPVRADDPAARATLEAILAYQNDPRVLSASPNYVLRTTRATPNDPYYPLQWHYDAIDLPNVWQLSSGSSDVIVAVIDTGVAPHEDLECGRTVPGYDFVDGDNDPTDTGTFETNGTHGTHVAGTIAACSNNGIGVAGVSDTSLQHIRALGPDGSGTLYGITLAIAWAAGFDTLPYGVPTNPNPADIINLSLGCSFCSSAFMRDAIVAASGAGRIVVAAAGNSTQPTARFYPAAYPTVIAVGASDASNDLAPYSNYGDRTDLIAPGSDVLSTTGDGTASGAYASFSGTSMAAPHVAGVIGIMRSLNPDLTWLSALKHLTSTATPTTGHTCQQRGCGAGLLNAPAAIQAALNNQPIGPHLYSNTPTTRIQNNANTLDLQLHNAGDQHAHTTITSNDHRLTPTPNSLTIAPNTSATITLTLDRDGLPTDSYNATITIATQNQNLPLTVTYDSNGGRDVGPVILQLLNHANENEVPFSSVTLEHPYEFVIPLLPAGSYSLRATRRFPCGDEGAVAFQLSDGQQLSGVEVPIVTGCF